MVAIFPDRFADVRRSAISFVVGGGLPPFSRHFVHSTSAAECRSAALAMLQVFQAACFVSDRELEQYESKVANAL